MLLKNLWSPGAFSFLEFIQPLLIALFRCSPLQNALAMYQSYLTFKLVLLRPTHTCSIEYPASVLFRAPLMIVIYSEDVEKPSLLWKLQCCQSQLVPP